MNIAEMNAEQLAEVAEALLTRMGELGRPAATAIIQRLGSNEDDHLTEGLSQMEDAVTELL